MRYLMAFLVMLAACTVGGDRDAHGCLVAAGYSWDEDVGACIRQWELAEGQRLAAGIAARHVNGQEMHIDAVEQGECEGCFEVTLNTASGRRNVSLYNWEIPVLSKEEARTIARECANLTGLSFYNNNSKTWWFDLDMQREGCAPACVVYEDRTSEINWRCTGLI